MSLNIGITVPFDNDQIILDSLYKLKDQLETEEVDYNQNISINWNENTDQIHSISFNDDKYFFRRYTKNSFFFSKTIEIRLQKKSEYKLSDSSNLIFVCIVSFDPMMKLGGSSSITIDFESKLVFISCEYKGVRFVEPKKNILFGVSDLYDNYLVVTPRKLLNYRINNFNIYSKNLHSRYNASIRFSDLESQKIGDLKYYIHKISSSEVNNYLLPSKVD